MFPSSDILHPLVAKMDRVCFLKNIITKPNVIVGDYTYYNDEVDVKYSFKSDTIIENDVWIGYNATSCLL